MIATLVAKTIKNARTHDHWYNEATLTHTHRTTFTVGRHVFLVLLSTSCNQLNAKLTRLNVETCSDNVSRSVYIGFPFVRKFTRSVSDPSLIAEFSKFLEDGIKSFHELLADHEHAAKALL